MKSSSDNNNEKSCPLEFSIKINKPNICYQWTSTWIYYNSSSGWNSTNKYKAKIETKGILDSST